MVEQVARRFALKPKRLAADTAYGSAWTLKSLMEQGIEPHIPVIDKSPCTDGLNLTRRLPNDTSAIGQSSFATESPQQRIFQRGAVHA